MSRMPPPPLVVHDPVTCPGQGIPHFCPDAGKRVQQLESDAHFLFLWRLLYKRPANVKASEISHLAFSLAAKLAPPLAEP